MGFVGALSIVMGSRTIPEQARDLVYHGINYSNINFYCGHESQDSVSEKQSD